MRIDHSLVTVMAFKKASYRQTAYWEGASLQPVPDNFQIAVWSYSLTHVHPSTAATRKRRLVKFNQAGPNLFAEPDKPFLSLESRPLFQLTFINVAYSRELRVAKSMTLQYLLVALRLAHLSTAIKFDGRAGANHMSRI